MSNNSDVHEIGHLPVLYLELIRLFEQARQLQEESTQLLDRARQIRATISSADQDAIPDDAPALDTADVSLSPGEALDEIITLLGDFSLETQMAITKALGLGLAATARAQLNPKRPLVA